MVKQEKKRGIAQPNNSSENYYITIFRRRRIVESEGLFTPVRGVRDTPLSTIDWGSTPSRTRLP